jgi:hypothetical protein
MATPIAQVPICWPLPSLAETVTSDHASAACYCGSENIGVVAVVISELKLRDVQRHIFGADFVECADNAALQDRPKTLNRVGMHRAHDVLMRVVIDLFVRELFFQIVAIAGPRVGRQQANLVGNGLVDELEHGFRIDALENLGNYFALALNGAHDLDLAPTGIARAAAPLIPMAVLVLAADVGFVNLDNAHEFLKFRVLESGADAVAHVPSRLVGAEAHVAVDLPGADTLLAGRHEVDDAEPLPQIDIRIFEDRADEVRKPIGAPLAAVGAFPAILHGLEGIDARRATARAIGPIRPALGDQVTVAGILVREGRLKLSDGHLHDLLGLFPGHDWASHV